MTGDEMLDALEHIDPDLIESADMPFQKRRKPYWVAAVAAVLILAIGMGAIFGGNGIPGTTTGPIQIDSHPKNPTNNPPGPDASSPSNFCFESIDQLLGLVDAAKKSQDALDHYIRTTNIGHWDFDYPLQSDIQLLVDLLNKIPIPCRNDHNITLNSIYYHPARFYDSDMLEVFYDINGIRYCFLASQKAAWKADGADVTIVTIGNVSGEMREGSYGSSRRMIAHFYMDDYVVSMWATTTNPNEVDLSGFSFGNLLDLNKS